MLAACTAGSLGFHAAPLRPLPALAAGRSGRPSMLDPGLTAQHVGQLLADAAILLPDPEPYIPGPAAGAEPSWFDDLVVFPFEYAIVGLHNGLKGIGITDAYGPSIIMFTIGVKALTFPLTKVQIESTTKMQAIAPAAKALQEKYRDRDPARLNSELQKLYADNNANPLAGCLPAIAQIPLFIGLYRSLLNLADANRLDESFLWLPSLEGPVRSYTEGISWLTQWENGVPRLGWADTLAYLVLPGTTPLALTTPPLDLQTRQCPRPPPSSPASETADSALPTPDVPPRPPLSPRFGAQSC